MLRRVSIEGDRDALDLGQPVGTDKLGGLLMVDLLVVATPDDAIAGIDFFDKVISVDQSPIGRTPRSNPATYTGMFTFIREQGILKRVRGTPLPPVAYFSGVIGPLPPYLLNISTESLRERAWTFFAFSTPSATCPISFWISSEPSRSPSRVTKAQIAWPVSSSDWPITRLSTLVTTSPALMPALSAALPEVPTVSEPGANPDVSATMDWLTEAVTVRDRLPRHGSGRRGGRRALHVVIVNEPISAQRLPEMAAERFGDMVKERVDRLEIGEGRITIRTR